MCVYKKECVLCCCCCCCFDLQHAAAFSKCTPSVVYFQQVDLVICWIFCFHFFHWLPCVWCLECCLPAKEIFTTFRDRHTTHRHPIRLNIVRVSLVRVRLCVFACVRLFVSIIHRCWAYSARELIGSQRKCAVATPAYCIRRSRYSHCYCRHCCCCRTRWRCRYRCWRSRFAPPPRYSFAILMLVYLVRY